MSWWSLSFTLKGLPYSFKRNLSLFEKKFGKRRDGKTKDSE
jgi:hypothetical protein